MIGIPLDRHVMHHQKVRRHGGYDPDFEGPAWSTPTQAGEAIGLVAKRSSLSSPAVVDRAPRA